MLGATGKIIVAVFGVPWDAFIAAFLYYSILTLVVLGGVDLSLPIMGGAYLAVPVAYGLLLARRAIHALGTASRSAGETGLVLH